MIGSLNEIILYVEDMAKQVAFYRDRLGFAVIEPAASDDWSQEYWVLLDTGPCKLALHGGGQRRLGEDAPKFVFAVEAIEAARAQLTSAGVKFGEVRSPAPGIFVADAWDPEGNVFSLEQRET
jgi:predicted enzyme related to lactoylglutathione lyase